MTVTLIAGVDEVGRGPLAGPVVAAAVILNPQQPIAGLKDSKQLSEKRREYFAAKIQEQALCYAFGRAEVAEIDRINILQATFLAMQRAVQALTIMPNKILIDGRDCPPMPYPAESIIRGDQTVSAISAASIIAKVHRDAEMIALNDQYPEYGFAQHKGYGTPQHIACIQKFGLTPVHRLSFTKKWQ